MALNVNTSADEVAENLLLSLFVDPGVRADPYPTYRALRERAAVYRSALGPVVLSRYDDCNRALRDHRLGKGNEGGGFDLGGVPNELRQRLFARRSGSSMLFANPPDHTRLRALAAKAFTPRRVEALRPEVERLVGDLLAPLGDGEVVDVMAALAFPLPVAVIGELLGIPAEDRAQFQPLVRDQVAAFEPFADDEVLDRALAASDESERYMADLVEQRHHDPRDDLLSALVKAEEGDDRLSREEVVATALLLFAAGFETTTNLIGNGLLALLRHPDQLERLRADPSLVRTAVEELLRWDSPVQIDARTVLDPAEVAGERLDPGEVVLTLLGSANRDPDRFVDPEAFDVGRTDATSISFASGIHFCLGAPLARLEGQVVLDALLGRFGSIELAIDEPEWRPTLTLRGLASLPVQLGAEEAT